MSKLPVEKKFNKAVEDIKRVCAKHGVVLVGTCDDEGIYGEISVYSDTDWVDQHLLDAWWNFENAIDKDRIHDTSD